MHFREEWRVNAVYEDVTGEVFKDTDFHAYLQKLDIAREEHTEWFHVNGAESKGYFYDFKSNQGVLDLPDTVMPYQLRNEQSEAVEKTIDYFNNHEKGEFLFKNDEEVSLLIRYLCFKVFKDDETKDLFEANNVTQLSLQ